MRRSRDDVEVGACLSQFLEAAGCHEACMQHDSSIAPKLGEMPQ